MQVRNAKCGVRNSKKENQSKVRCPSSARNAKIFSAITWQIPANPVDEKNNFMSRKIRQSKFTIGFTIYDLETAAVADRPLHSRCKWLIFAGF
jgi:hypothetical protein